MKKTMRSGEGWRMRAGWSRLTASASGAGRLAVGLAACPTLVAGLSGPALAHTAERSFVPTLPTGLYIAGGAIVVAVSFLLVALVPAANLRLVERAVWRVGQAPDICPRSSA